MKKINRTIALFSLFALLLAPNTAHEDALAATESLAECVTEVSSRRVLYEKNGDCDLPMASTTKVLTAILIIDDCNLDEKVIVPAEAAGVEGSSVYLRAGDCLTVRDLLYGLMLRSGNDCAVALALHHSGTIAKFAQKMNEKAALLGAVNSRFANPHGLPDKRHYTTARDLALVAAYAMENETFCEIVSCKYYAPKNWHNKNKMLYEYDGAIGVKTGFTLNAGRCLVTSAQRGEMKLVSVVLNSPQMYERSAELLDRSFETYRMYLLC
ncbi:MAG: D-alanyl-D-alanine carboxypeptidase family protein, partial [Candidatus Gallimonas sp.]